MVNANAYGRRKYNNTLIQYKNSNDDNNAKDCRIDMFYSSEVGLLSMTDDFVSNRKIDIDSSVESVSDTTNTIIYDAAYENNNNGDKRFVALKKVLLYSGAIVTLLLDKQENTLLLTKVIDSLNPDLVKNKHLEFSFMPLGKVNPNANGLTSVSLSNKSEMSKIVLDSNQTINEIQSKIKLVNLKLFKPLTSRIALFTDVNLNSTYKARIEFGLLVCLSIPQSILDLDNCDFNLMHIFDYEEMQEGLIPSTNIDKVDTYYIPIS